MPKQHDLQQVRGLQRQLKSRWIALLQVQTQLKTTEEKHRKSRFLKISHHGLSQGETQDQEAVDRLAKGLEAQEAANDPAKKRKKKVKMKTASYTPTTALQTGKHMATKAVDQHKKEVK